ncbi:hypothetical protein TNCV_244691 [Trichonephila clavipes]|uniref:Uncharacterized protein n=1 Tax=Trichonephila clavipes TaxID=2585209 RepID=A0A8X6RPK9_TRICX|nr:hypothetical protein TNCV_244691 [Trichonephila clavipes]
MLPHSSDVYEVLPRGSDEYEMLPRGSDEFQPRRLKGKVKGKAKEKASKEEKKKSRCSTPLGGVRDSSRITGEGGDDLSAWSSWYHLERLGVAETRSLASHD